MMARDVTGRSVILPESFAELQKGQAFLLVYGGSCTECALDKITPDTVSKATAMNVVLFFTAAESKIPHSQGRVRSFSDADYKIHRVLQPAWPGQWYVVRGNSVVGQQRTTDDRVPKAWK
jgi:hypothetical protein